MLTVLLQPMLRTLGGVTAATLYIADTLLANGEDVLIVTKKKQNLVHYEIEDISEYYAIKNVTPKHVTAYDYESVYSAVGDSYSTEFIDLLRSADRVFSFDEGLSLMPDTVGGLKNFYQYYHFPSPAAPPSLKAGIYCNSKFTAQYIEQYYHRKATVLYPIPDPAFYNHSKSFEERDIDVLYVGRLSSDKNIEAIRYLSNKGFSIVIGGAAWYDNQSPALDGIDAEVKRSQTIKDLIDLYSRSKVFVSVKGMGTNEPLRMEHFGICTVEAAYSGAVPVVHRSGGPYIDFLGEGRVYGRSYTTAFEMVESVNWLLSSKDKWQAFSENAYRRGLELRAKSEKAISLNNYKRI